MSNPSLNNGFASPWYGGALKYPGLWSGCVGAWAPLLGPTGGLLFDSSGYSNHGTLTNMDPATDWVMDRYGYALDFDNANDVVNCGAKTVFEPDYVTVAAWAKINSWDTGGYDNIAGKEEGSPPYFGYLLRQEFGQLQFIFAVQGGTFYKAFTTSLPSAGVWHHYAGTYDGSVGRLYVDGVQVGSVSISGTVRKTGTAFSIGDGLAFSGRVFNGRIAEVSLFNRAYFNNELTFLAQRPGIMYELNDDPNGHLLTSEGWHDEELNPPIESSTNKSRSNLAIGLGL